MKSFETEKTRAELLQNSVYIILKKHKTTKRGLSCLFLVLDWPPMFGLVTCFQSWQNVRLLRPWFSGFIRRLPKLRNTWICMWKRKWSLQQQHKIFVDREQTNATCKIFTSVAKSAKNHEFWREITEPSLETYRSRTRAHLSRDATVS